jgi:hypothetical protein
VLSATEFQRVVGVAEALVGMSETDGETYARDRGCELRVVRRDNLSAGAVTADYRPRRIDVYVLGGVIVGTEVLVRFGRP